MRVFDRSYETVDSAGARSGAQRCVLRCDHAEPGVLYLARVNDDSHLSYCKNIAATNPCAEQPLPPCGCCCLGSIDLTRFVHAPFETAAWFDEAAFVNVAQVATRMLDDVLDVTVWPLRQEEARSKRPIAELTRDAACEASVELAREREAFPLFNADLYLTGTTFASRLPDGSFKQYAVEDHAWRMYRPLKGDTTPLTPAFVTALEMSAQAHEAIVAAVAPRIDTAIWKTVNVPADCTHADFQHLYPEAWESGLEGLANCRPNSVLGSVLSVAPVGGAAAVGPLQIDGANRRLALERRPAPVLSSLRWPGRPGPAFRGLGQLRRTAALPGCVGEDLVDGPARQRPGVAAAQARCAGHGGCTVCVRDAVPTPRRTPLVPRRCGGHRGGGPLALRAAQGFAAARPQRRDAGDGHDVQRRRASHRALEHAGLDGRYRQPRQRRSLHADAEGSDAAGPRPHDRDAALRRRLFGRLTAHARRTGALAVARHARDRPGLDRHEAAQAAELR